jgi:hypothetical protein
VLKMATAPKTAPANNKPSFDKNAVKVLGHVVIPSMTVKGLKQGDELYLRYESEITSKEQTETEGVNAGKIKLDPKTGTPSLIHVVNATNLETGEFGQVVVGAIVHSAHAVDARPLTGRAFRWTKGAESTGKATKWQVVEIEV